MKPKIYMMNPRPWEGAIGNHQPALHDGHTVVINVFCAQKTVLRFHPTAKTRAEP